jgi:hypothetical protein
MLFQFVNVTPLTFEKEHISKEYFRIVQYKSKERNIKKY